MPLLPEIQFSQAAGLSTKCSPLVLRLSFSGSLTSSSSSVMKFTNTTRENLSGWLPADSGQVHRPSVPFHLREVRWALLALGTYERHGLCSKITSSTQCCAQAARGGSTSHLENSAVVGLFFTERVRFPNPRARSNGDNECTKMIVMAATGNGNSSDQERKMLIFKVRDLGSQDTQLQPQQMVSSLGEVLLCSGLRLQDFTHRSSSVNIYLKKKE